MSGDGRGAAAEVARVVSFSGGLGSWYAARRVREEHGPGRMELLFTDVAQEDEDLYRFLIEGAADILGVPLGDVADLSARALDLPPVWRRDLKAERLRLLEGLARDAEERVPGLAWITQGKDVWDVFFEQRFLGNSRIDPCSRILKRETAEKWVKARYGPEEVVVYLGIDWTEEARHLKTQGRWSPYPVESPLCEEPRDEDPKGAAKNLLAASGIELPRLYRLAFKHNNCFAHSTRFITAEGVRELGEAVDEDVRVLTSRGKWANARIKSFGTQRLLRVTMRRYGRTKVVEATPDHRWFRRTSSRAHTRTEVATSELGPGDVLVSLFPKPGAGVEPSAFGVAHGIVFGDGTRPRYKDGRGWNPPANVVLCGEKDKELLRWFPNSPTREVPGIGVRVNNLPHHFKNKPPLTESRSYLLGWLAGYFAADGHVSKDGIPTLHSARRDNLEFARAVATLIGFPTLGVGVTKRRGLGREETELFKLAFAKGTLPEQFFLLSAHRANHGPRRFGLADWRVVSVEDTGHEEEVFCAVVPETGAFVLEDNILTGNCAGACVKAGKGQWAHLLRTMPEAYRYHEEQELELREHLGKDVTILREQRDGVRYGITLRELRERAEAGWHVREQEGGAGDTKW